MLIPSRSAHPMAFHVITANYMPRLVHKGCQFFPVYTNTMAKGRPRTQAAPPAQSQAHTQPAAEPDQAAHRRAGRPTRDPAG